MDKFFFHHSFSQKDEEHIIRLLFPGNRKQYKGFYIDAGAQHPYRFSGTLPLYLRGWTGINIEPTPDAISLFKILRKRDINLQAGIRSEAGIFPFYCFKDPALNSFSYDKTAHNAGNTRYTLKKVIDLKTMTLVQVLDEYLPEGTTIDLLNIDTDEFDLEVLKSNDWDKYIPLFIVIEAYIAIEHLINSEIYEYLLAKNYELVAKTGCASFFKLIENHSANKTP